MTIIAQGGEEMIVEFIESYRKNDDGGDYLYNDNHGLLVRCRNCEYWKHHSVVLDHDYCELTSTECDGDHFCSWGEKRNDETVH